MPLELPLPSRPTHFINISESLNTDLARGIDQDQTL
jgi:hypothetical protein